MWYSFCGILSEYQCRYFFKISLTWSFQSIWFFLLVILKNIFFLNIRKGRFQSEGGIKMRSLYSSVFFPWDRSFLESWYCLIIQTVIQRQLIVPFAFFSVWAIQHISFLFLTSVVKLYEPLVQMRWKFPWNCLCASPYSCTHLLTMMQRCWECTWFSAQVYFQVYAVAVLNLQIFFPNFTNVC